MPMPGRAGIVVQQERDKEFWAVAGKVLRQLCVMKIEEARAQPPRLAVDNVKHLHLFTFGEPDKTHEGELKIHVIEMAQPMLAVHLGKHRWGSLGYLQPHPAVAEFDNAPKSIGTGAEVEGQRDSGAIRLLDIAPEIEAMLEVAATLIASPRVLVEHVREADGAQ